MAALQQDLSDAQKRYDTGMASRTDTSQTEARLAEARANLKRAETNSPAQWHNKAHLQLHSCIGPFVSKIVAVLLDICFVLIVVWAIQAILRYAK